MNKISGVAKCVICGEDEFAIAMSTYRKNPKQTKADGLICADCVEKDPKTE